MTEEATSPGGAIVRYPLPTAIDETDPDPAARVDRSALPTMGEMINDQTGMNEPVISQEELARRYAAD